MGPAEKGKVEGPLKKARTADQEEAPEAVASGAEGQGASAAASGAGPFFGTDYDESPPAAEASGVAAASDESGESEVIKYVDKSSGFEGEVLGSGWGEGSLIELFFIHWE